MQAELQSLLAQLERDPPSWTPAAAIENLRMLHAQAAQDPAGLEEFLESAAQACLAHASRAGVRPATFYVWHDAQAGQLRFSVALCTPDSLPFGSAVSLVDRLTPIINSAAEDAGHIPWGSLTEVEFAQAGDNAQDAPLETVLVWARCHGTAA